MQTIYRNGMRPMLFFSLRILALHRGQVSGKVKEKIFALQCWTQRTPGSECIVKSLMNFFMCSGFLNNMLMKQSRSTWHHFHLNALSQRLQLIRFDDLFSTIYQAHSFSHLWLKLLLPENIIKSEHRREKR